MSKRTCDDCNQPLEGVQSTTMLKLNKYDAHLALHDRCARKRFTAPTKGEGDG